MLTRGKFNDLLKEFAENEKISRIKVNKNRQRNFSDDIDQSRLLEF